VKPNAIVVGRRYRGQNDAVREVRAIHPADIYKGETVSWVRISGPRTRKQDTCLLSTFASWAVEDLSHEPIPAPGRLFS
jgi:hypothetical protein